MNLRAAVTWLLVSAVLFSAPLQAQTASSADEHAHHQGGTQPESKPMADGSTADSKEATASEQEHVAPDPPAHLMEAMPYKPMAEMMGMDDTEIFGKVLVDQLEWRNMRGADAGVWEAQAWYGGDYNKLWFKLQGERRDSVTEEARIEALWDRNFSRWWSLQAGARSDLGEGPRRHWAALGVEGLAPYWFDVEATVYVGEAGRTAARFKAEYDLLFTQRLILQPELEINLYGKNDAAKGIGAGFSDLDLGLRLRYEIRREFAPYVGINWMRRFGKSAEFARDAGDDPNDVQVLAGLRVWF